MKPVGIIVAVILLFLFSCDDDERSSFKVTGVIIDESSGKPIENVEIIGFLGGVSINNVGECYGEAVSLGTTDKCGQFKITLSNSIKGLSGHGISDMTTVMLRLSRPDFGVQNVPIPFKRGAKTLSMTYSPIREPFFRSLYLVQSEDGKSVHIGWNIYSLYYFYYCKSEWCGPCAHPSDGNLYIQRSDSSGYNRYAIPIEVDNQRKITDSDLPAGNFNYSFHPGDTRPTYIKADVIRTNFDTLFLVKPPAFPTLNHCN